LDPAGPLYELNNKEQQLYYTDAKFVDVIHTSDELTGQGLGKFDPIGHMDFYPNGGRVQMEACNTAKEANASGDTLTELESPYYVTICNHKMSIKFFLHSILDCDYLSTKCEEYESLPICSSKGNPTAKMGFFAKSIKDIKPAQSKFYLKTSGNKPFC
ncbi:Lipase member I, partial [Araneus ventricosus]